MQAAAEILGRVKGESVSMLVHHSRNSAQKQWDETLVLALGGMGRLLRAHLPLLARMPAFTQVRAHSQFSRLMEVMRRWCRRWRHGPLAARAPAAAHTHARTSQVRT